MKKLFPFVLGFLLFLCPFAVQAVESLFSIIDRGITDRENAEHIKEIKESLNALEGGKVVDV